MADNIKLDYPVNIRIENEVFHCREGAEFFLDEHNNQWVKFVPSNGYAPYNEHMARTERIIVVQANKKAKARIGEPRPA